MAKKKQYALYTDGSFRKPRYGAWAAIILDSKGTKIHTGSGAVFDTTSPRMELTAILEGLRWLKTPSQVTIYSDNSYAVLALKKWLPVWRRNDWKTYAGSPVKNKDIMEELFLQRRKHKLVPIWVKGHNGNTYNEECDKIVQDMTLKMVAGKIPDPNAPKK